MNEHDNDKLGVAPYTEEGPVSTRSTEGELVGGDELRPSPERPSPRDEDQPGDQPGAELPEG